MTLQFGTFVPQGWRLDLVEIHDPVEKYEAMTRVGQAAEQAGYDSIWAYDHFHTYPTAQIEAFINNARNRAGEGINGDPDVLGYDKPVIRNGHIQLSERPGFGIELNEQLIRERYLVDGEQMWT